MATGRQAGMIVLAPVAPSPGGAGLPGRLAVLAQAAAQDHRVHLVIARDGNQHTGPEPQPPAAMRPVHGGSLTHLEVTVGGQRRAARDLVSDMVPVLAAVDARSIQGVLALGLDLAPFGLGLADWLGVPLVLDAAGDHDGLLLSDRPAVQAAPEWYLAAGCVAEASLVLVPTAEAGQALEECFHVAGRTAVVPAAAPILPWQVESPTRTGQVLCSTDLTDPAELAGARWLTDEVLPLLPPTFTLDLVGPAGPEARALAGDGVRVLGPVPDLLACYQFADVAVAPVAAPGRGADQVLEAFAHRRAVVATTSVARTLTVTPGVHLRTADAPDAFASAIVASVQPSSSSAAAIVEAQVAAAFEVATGPHHPDAVRAAAAAALALAGAVPRATGR